MFLHIFVTTIETQSRIIIQQRAKLWLICIAQLQELDNLARARRSQLICSNDFGNSRGRHRAKLKEASCVVLVLIAVSAHWRVLSKQRPVEGDRERGEYTANARNEKVFEREISYLCKNLKQNAAKKVIWNIENKITFISGIELPGG